MYCYLYNSNVLKELRLNYNRNWIDKIIPALKLMSFKKKSIDEKVNEKSMFYRDNSSFVPYSLHF